MEKLFRKYLNGTCTPDEYRMVNEFIQNRGNDKLLDGLMKNAWNSTEVQGIETENVDLLGRIHHQIALKENKSSNKNLAIYRISLQIAAVLVVGLIFTSVWFYSNRVYTPEIVQNISTPLASRTSFELPDGSKVWLNAGSSISFPGKFDGKTRSVKLIGEAYFDVKSDQIPFLVETPKFTVNVLGTAFNVMAYNGEPASVTLERGKVELQNEGKSLGFLDPGQQAQFSQGSDKINIEKVESEIFTSWKENRLIFQAEPLELLAKRLERWYNLKIVIGDPSLNNLKVTGKIEVESFSEVLDLMEYTLPIKYQYNKNERILTILKKK
ncbi:MAG: FecR domain-containing protein [Prolixibacteraceae bacterium]|nr:FecR domain-containing protein [Prolixibacteraceae bacterium]